MDKGFDTDAVLDRARDLAQDVRHSDAYPAIVGGIAGGVAGALMAVLITSRYKARSEPLPQSISSDRRAGLAIRDVVQLLGVIAGLVKQARDWYDQGRSKK